MRSLLGSSAVAGLLLATNTAAGQELSPAVVPTQDNPPPYVHIDLARAGVPPMRFDTVVAHPRGTAIRRVKHAAIGAVVGTVAGAVAGGGAGLIMDASNRTDDAMIPATLILGVYGAAIGFGAGLVIGAFVP